MSVSSALLCSFELLKPLDGAQLKQHIKKGRNRRANMLNSPVCLLIPCPFIIVVLAWFTNHPFVTACYGLGAELLRLLWISYIPCFTSCILVLPSACVLWFAGQSFRLFTCSPISWCLFFEVYGIFLAVRFHKPMTSCEHCRGWVFQPQNACGAWPLTRHFLVVMASLGNALNYSRPCLLYSSNWERQSFPYDRFILAKHQTFFQISYPVSNAFDGRILIGKEAVFQRAQEASLQATDSIALAISTEAVCMIDLFTWGSQVLSISSYICFFLSFYIANVYEVDYIYL